MKKRILLALFLIVLSLLSACRKDPSAYGDSIYSNIKAPAFSGYICGYEGSKTFLQLPIFIQTDSELSINEITNISLTGDKVTFPCSDYSLSSFTESKYDGYKFATLSFRTSLEKKGNFQLSKINIVFSDQSEAQLNLGEINLDIRANQAPEIEYLSMSQFFVNQAEPSTLRISYTNNTNEPITINNFSYPSDICTGVEIEKYSDFELSTKENDLIIPPTEEKTFVVTFDFDSDFINNEGQFYYFLPFVEYKINNTEVVIPGQTQATIVQIPFSEKIIKKIIN